MLTPDDFERRTGIKLRLVQRPGKAALLVADMARIGRAGKVNRRAKNFSPQGRNLQSVPIFVLVPVIKFRGTLSLQPAIDRAQRELVDNFIRLATAT